MEWLKWAKLCYILRRGEQNKVHVSGTLHSSVKCMTTLDIKCYQVETKISISAHNMEF